MLWIASTMGDAATMGRTTIQADVCEGEPMSFKSVDQVFREWSDESIRDIDQLTEAQRFTLLAIRRIVAAEIASLRRELAKTRARLRRCEARREGASQADSDGG